MGGVYMKGTFNLSEKMIDAPFGENLLDVRDVKEFIKRLKEEIPNEYLNGVKGSRLKRKINALAGDKLK
jgi:hypothetical protein